MTIYIIFIVIPSIHGIENLKPLDAIEENVNVVILDEGDNKLRSKNDKFLVNVPHRYFGPEERKKWFKNRFGSIYEKYADLIPRNCHAETSFGFLLAYEQNADVVIEIDDDVYISKRFIRQHIENLTSDGGLSVYAKGKWYNTLENLMLNLDSPVYPRGHLYDSQARQQNYRWKKVGGRCVLNMGLWIGDPDLDALTIVYNRGLHGKCHIKAKKYKREKIIVGKGTYFAICSMNLSFATKIIPAFYQFYMNFLGVDRFDDIWSGIFLKKIADHVGERLCLGKPFCLHLKRPRNIFDDLRRELEGMMITERLWRLVDDVELSCRSYADCYLELAEYLDKTVNQKFNESLHRKFIKTQVRKMKTWVDCLDKLV